MNSVVWPVAQGLYHPSLMWSAMPLPPVCLTPTRVVIHNIRGLLGDLRTKVRVVLPAVPCYPWCQLHSVCKDGQG